MAKEMNMLEDAHKTTHAIGTGIAADLSDLRQQRKMRGLLQPSKRRAR